MHLRYLLSSVRDSLDTPHTPTLVRLRRLATILSHAPSTALAALLPLPTLALSAAALHHSLLHLLAALPPPHLLPAVCATALLLTSAAIPLLPRPTACPASPPPRRLAPRSLVALFRRLAVTHRRSTVMLRRLHLRSAVLAALALAMFASPLATPLPVVLLPPSTVAIHHHLPAARLHLPPCSALAAASSATTLLPAPANSPAGQG